MREVISAVTVRSGTAALKRKDRATLRNTPLRVDSKATRSNRTSACAMPKPSATTGAKKGATSMAPMMTAGLFCCNPKVAIKEAKPIMMKKSARERAPPPDVPVHLHLLLGIELGNGVVHRLP